MNEVRTKGTRVIVSTGYFEGMPGTVISNNGPSVMIEVEGGTVLYFDSTDLDVVK